MSFPRLSTAQHTAQQVDADVLVIGVQNTPTGPATLPRGQWPELDASLASIGITGSADELVRLPTPTGVAAKSIALVGIGKTVTPETLRYAAGVAGRRLLGIDSLALSLPAESEADATAILEGAGIGAYAYLDYREAAAHQAKSPASTITLLVRRAIAASVTRDASAVVTATHEVRDLVNAPPIDLYPASFVDRARALADGLSVSTTVCPRRRRLRRHPGRRSGL
jgi:leucyl aminopeptidase